jgi:hypothetical protein
MDAISGLSLALDPTLILKAQTITPDPWQRAVLGAPGRWLQGKHGRTLVGIAGIFMLLAAAGLAVRDCLEWTR